MSKIIQNNPKNGELGELNESFLWGNNKRTRLKMPRF